MNTPSTRIRHFALLFVCTAIYFTPNATLGQTFRWAFSCGADGGYTSISSLPTIEGMGVDPSNNIYISGQTWESSDFDPGPDSLIFTNMPHIYGTGYLAKYDMTGNLLWGFNLNNPSTGGVQGYNNRIQDLVVDDAGDVYVSIYTQPEVYTSQYVDLDPGPAVSGYLGNSFLAKYSAAGNLVWATTAAVGHLHLDKFGHLYHYVEHTVNCYDLSGNRLYSKSFDGVNSILQLETDSAGNIYASGSFIDTLDVDWNSGISKLIIPDGQEGIFIAKYNMNANLLASNYAYGKDNFDLDNSILIGDNGNIFLKGTFNDTVFFNSTPSPIVLDPDGYNYSMIFIAKFDNALNFSWAKKLGPTLSGHLYFDANKNLMLHGNVNSYNVDWDPGPAVVKLPWTYEVGIGTYNQNGALLNLANFFVSGKIAWGKQNDFYLSGLFSLSQEFDANNSIVAVHDYQVFLARYNYVPPVGIAENLNPDRINIFPNPTSNGLFTLNIPNYQECSKIEILDLSGKSIQVIDKQILEFTALKLNASAGMYFIRLHMKDGNRISKNIVVQ